MPRHQSGYVKLHRKIYFGALSRDGHAWALLGLIVSFANLKPGSAALKRQPFVLQRGQLATSLDELVLETGFSKTIVHKRLKKLEKLGTISQEITSRGRVITVCNYETYQSINTEVDTVGNTVVGNVGSTVVGTHSEEERREKKEYSKAKTKTERTLTWDESDKLHKPLTNLATSPGYGDVFDAPKDRAHIEALMLRYAIPLIEMTHLTADLAIWAIAPPRPVKNWRSTLNRFCKNHVEHRAKSVPPSGQAPSLFATYGLNPDGTQA